MCISTIYPVLPDIPKKFGSFGKTVENPSERLILAQQSKDDKMKFVEDNSVFYGHGLGHALFV